MKIIYQVCGVDSGGYPSGTVGFFESKKDAEYVKNKETMYSSGSIIEHKVFETVKDYKDSETQSIINKAKNKLTEEERQLLNIK